MRLTRFSAVLFTVAIPTLVACGGDDGGGITIPDAKVFQDAPIDVSTACSAPAMIPGGGSIGNMTTPATVNGSGDWIEKDADGNIAFDMRFRPSQQDMQNILVFILPKPELSGFAPGTFNFDPNPASGDDFSALAFIQANVDFTAGTVGRLLWASNGSITLSAIGSNMDDLITGTLSAVNYREIDFNTGADVAGGCVSQLGADVKFYLKQKSTVTRQVPSQGGRPAHLRVEAVIGLETAAN